MGKNARRTRRRTVAAVGVIAALVTAGYASAFQALPPGDQVNNDPSAGINPALPVNINDPANSDVVGGSLVATKPLVPWAIFRQSEASPNKDQIFSRSFCGNMKRFASSSFSVLKAWRVLRASVRATAGRALTSSTRRLTCG